MNSLGSIFSRYKYLAPLLVMEMSEKEKKNFNEVFNFKGENIYFILSTRPSKVNIADVTNIVFIQMTHIVFSVCYVWHTRHENIYFAAGPEKLPFACARA